MDRVTMQMPIQKLRSLRSILRQFDNTGHRRVLGFFLIWVLPAFVSSAWSQQANSDLQEKVAALKESVAQNQQNLRRYRWVETSETILKGETKSTKQSQCQYGPDGKVQKTTLAASAPPKQKKGLRGRVVEKKTDEMKDYMERVASLIQRYVPPDGSQIQESFQSGKSILQPSAGGIVTIVLRDYAKPGDTVSLAFDAASKKIQGYDVSTFLDAPEDVVTLKVVFETLADGTSHVAQSVLDATAKQIQIRNTNSGYNRI
jgi:hypothetical protein